MVDFVTATHRLPDTVVVIASGPSLSTRQVRAVATARLEGRAFVVVVNDAVYLAWWADWLHACDAKWWFWHAQRVQHFAGIKTSVSEDLPAGFGAATYKMSGELGYDPTPGVLRHGSNGGYQAIHIAMQGRPRRILAVGIDCRGTDHFFGNHPDEIYPDWAAIARNFDSLVTPARELGIRIVNCAPNSAVSAFERGDIEKELAI